MRWIFLLFFVRLFAVDFDCVFVGTSPIPLFEALYQRQLGKSVLILEREAVCGGAWKTIAVCGMEQVDLGCHHIGYTPELKEFLETYAGCKVVPMEGKKFTPRGLYFSRGCSELIGNLVRLVERLGIVLLLEHTLESVSVDQDELLVKAGDQTFTTNELFYTPMTAFAIENPSNSIKFSPRRPKYHHLYLLLCDPSLPQFSYRGYGVHGASRIMNLTPFLGLEQLGRQMIVLQLRSEEAMRNGPLFLEDLKKKQLVGPSAYILREEAYTYETGCAPQRIPPEWNGYFKRLQTSGFLSMTHQIPRWKEVLRPFCEIFP